MVLASGAHIKLGSYEFMVDESQENHYVHQVKPMTLTAAEIIGGLNKFNSHTDRIIWMIDDWSGGEGNFVWNPQDPTGYWYSTGLNPRIKGVLTGPTRAPYGFNSGAGSYYHMDGTTARVHTDETANTYAISGGEINDGTAITTGYNGITEGVGCYHDGRYYIFNGKALWEIDVNAYTGSALDSTYFRKAYSPYRDSKTVGRYGMVSAENSVFMFVTNAAGDISTLHEYNDEAGSVAWVSPLGYNIKAILYHAGVLWVLGTYAVNGTAASLWAFDLNSRAMTFVKSIRNLPNADNETHWVNPVFLGPGQDNAVLIGCDSKVFSYNPDTDGLSLMAPVAGHWAYLKDTYIKLFDGTNYPIDHLANLANIVMQTNNRLWTGWYDFGTPFERKNLLGINLSFKPLTGGQIIKVATAGDDGSYTVRATITANTATNSLGYAYVPVSTSSATVGFNRLSLRIALECGVAGTNHVQTLDFTGMSTGDTTKFTWRTIESANSIAYENLGASAIQAILETVEGMTGNITVAEVVAGTSYAVTFHTAYAYSSVSALSMTTPSGFTPKATDGYTDGVKSTTSPSGGSSPEKPPVLYAIATEAQLTPNSKNSEETWELALRLKDEPSNNARPRHRANAGSKLRDWVMSTIATGGVLSMKDGYRYSGNNVYSTHEVTIKEYQDVIDKHGEGYMRVLLGRVSAAS